MRKSLFLATELVASSLLATRPGRRRVIAPARIASIGGRLPLSERTERTLGVEQASRNYLMFVVLPLWLGAAVLDWRHHRRTKIERTAGTHESLIHLLMMAEVGAPVLMGLLLEVNSLVLLLMIVGYFLHEATAFWDVAYAETIREVTPSEQHVHSFLEVIPFMVASFMVVLHWDQALALVGAGREPVDLTLHAKRPPLARGYVAGILASVAAFVAVPYVEEFIRCYRADRTLAAHPSPVHPPQEARV
jgi:hypothetical protein